MACFVPGCDVKQPEAGRPACKAHWFGLSSPLRIAIYSATKRYARDGSVANLERLRVLETKAVDYLRERAEL